MHLKITFHGYLLILISMLLITLSLIMNTLIFILASSILLFYLMYIIHDLLHLYRDLKALIQEGNEIEMILDKEKSIEVNISSIYQTPPHKTVLEPLDLNINMQGITYEKLTSRVLFQGEAKLRFRLKAFKIGEYSLKGIRLRIYHPTGLAYREETLRLNTILRVYPETYRIILGILTGTWGMYGETSQGIFPPSTRGQDYYGSREFVPGDEPRSIDWKATARVAKLMVKEFFREGGGSLLLILDYASRLISDIILDAIGRIAISIISSCLQLSIPIAIGLWKGGKLPENIIGPIRNEEEAGILYLSILRLFEQPPQGFLDSEVRLRMVKISSITPSRVTSETLNLQALEHFRTIMILTGLQSPIESIIELKRIFPEKRVIVIIPRPWWLDLKDDTLRSLGRRYFKKKVLILEAHDIHTSITSPEELPLGYTLLEVI